MTNPNPNSDAGHEQREPSELSIGVMDFLQQLRGVEDEQRPLARTTVWEPLGSVEPKDVTEAETLAAISEAQAKIDEVRDELTTRGYTFRSMHDDPIDHRRGVRMRQVYTAIGDGKGELAALVEVFYYGDEGTTGYRPQFWSSLGEAEQSMQKDLESTKREAA